MIMFLLGLSFAFNLIYTILLIFYIKHKMKEDFFNDNSVVDKAMAYEFFN